MSKLIEYVLTGEKMKRFELEQELDAVKKHIEQFERHKKDLVGALQRVDVTIAQYETQLEEDNE